MAVMKKPRILVIGSMNMDLCMYGIAELPRWGVSTFCNGYQYAAGGKGFNQAYAAAKQGAEVYMAGRVGNDANGRQLLKHLDESGVRSEYVVVDERYSTGLSTMNMGKDGRYFSIYAPGANSHIQTKDVERSLSGCVFDMIVIQLEMPLEVVYQICELGEERKIPVFLDAGPAMAVPLEKLKGTFVISPNEAETEALTGITPDTPEHIEEAASVIFEKACPQNVLLKLGNRGAYYYNKEEKRLLPGFFVNAIDTTAAGDTFGAAFCTEYCLSHNLVRAVLFAHAAAAVCVTRRGGQPSIPTREEAERFLRDAACKVLV